MAMSSQIPLSLPNLPNQLTAIQSDPSQKSDKSESPCMAPRASAIEEQGLSEAVAARIEAPQRGLIRSVYEASGPFFTKVDFGAPPLKSVADFLMYLFQDRKLQPSTIDGYRSAIADRLGNSPINISKDEISLVSWIVSTETDPKAGGESPPGTSPWFLHQLTRFILNQLKRPP